MLDPDGVTRTKALGSERMARKLRDALPGGDERAARRRLGVHAADALARARRAQPRHVRHRRAATRRTVDLDGHRAASDLDELDLDDEPDAEAA